MTKKALVPYDFPSVPLVNGATTWFVTPTGTNATGTWGISVSGTAAAVPWSGITSKPTTLSGYGVTDAEYRSPLGVPRNNLGDPTVREMALFDGQFTNKTELFDISNIFIETSTDNSTWAALSVSDTDKRRLVTGDYDSSLLSIPYGTPYFRIRLRSVSYVFLDSLYAYWSSNGHSTRVQIFKKHDSGSWIQHTSSLDYVSSWPGHLHLPFSTIPFMVGGTVDVHWSEVYILFQPSWNASFSANGINIFKMQLWGGYPAGKRNLYSTDEFGNAIFPAAVSSTSLSATNVSGTNVSSTNGFQNTVYLSGARNRIWSFGNADGYGLSYFKSTAGLLGNQDTIGIHMGTATAASSAWTFNMADLSFRSAGPILQGGNQVLHAGNYTSYVSPRIADNTNGLRIANPGGGSFVSTAPITGAIKIRLPAAAKNTSTMVRFTVKIYVYATGYSRTIEVGGYNYAGDQIWRNCFAHQSTQNGDDINVRFGQDATGDCVWIGDVGAVWDYPQVFVTDVQCGYSNYTDALWGTGWNISVVTAFDTVDEIIVARRPLTSGNYASYVPTNAVNAANATNATYAVIQDTRAGLLSPNDYTDFRATFEFTNQIIGDWKSAMTLQGWHDGFAAWQIIGPAGTSATEDFYLRSGVGTTWNPLRTIIHSGNYTSYSPSLTGTGASGTWGISVTGNANTVDGYHIQVDGTGTDPNTIYLKTTGGSITVAWADITGKPTTRDGYGITDVPKTDGTSATGTWGIGITGNAATASNATQFGSKSDSLFVFGDTVSGSNSANATQNVYELAQYKSGFWETTAAGWTPDTGWWWGATFAHRSNSGSYNFSGQLAFQNGGGGNNLYARTISNGTPSGWARLLSSGNYSDYTVTKTGTGASGTWGISITGNAATVTNGVYTTGNQSIAGNKTFSGTTALAETSTVDGVKIGFRNVPVNLSNAALALSAAYDGECVYKNNTTAYTYTIPDGLPDGTVFTIANCGSAGNITLSMSGTEVLRLAGTTSTGARTIAPYGEATVHRVGGMWLCGGAGVT